MYHQFNPTPQDAFFKSKARNFKEVPVKVWGKVTITWKAIVSNDHYFYNVINSATTIIENSSIEMAISKLCIDADHHNEVLLTKITCE